MSIIPTIVGLPEIIEGLISPGIYHLQPNETLDITEDVMAEDVTIVKQRGDGAEPSVRIWEGGVLRKAKIMSGYNVGVAEVELRGPGAVGVEVDVRNSYCGFWVRAGANDCVLKDCISDNNAHNCRIGELDQDGWVLNLDIIGGQYTNSPTDDGIKALRRTKGLRVTNAVCTGNAKDGIDLFAGGDGVIIDGCTLSDNGANGVDIKTDSLGYPTDQWGVIKDILVRNSTLDRNVGAGVKVWRPRDWKGNGDQPTNILVRNCTFDANEYAGFFTRVDDMIVEDCVFSNSLFGSYFVGIPVALSGYEPNRLVVSGSVKNCTYNNCTYASHNNMVDSVCYEGNTYNAGDDALNTLSVVQGIVYEKGAVYNGYVDSQGNASDGKSVQKGVIIPE